MHLSLCQSAVLGLAAIRAVHAHTQFMGLYVNGVSVGDSTGIRMSDVQGQEGSPIAGITSNDMACNVHGDKGVARVVNIKATDTLTFEWRSWPDEAAKVPIDPSHKGPCSVYAKKVDSAIQDQGHGDGWFKLWHEGYDEATGQWCIDKLDADRGHVSIKLPANILGGYYLIRPEILALHAAQAPEYDPQFYAGCAQVFVDSDGDQVPTSTVSIPGYVSAQDPGLTYNVYAKTLKDYPIPGPDVATFKSSGNVKATTAADQTEGLRPADCVLVAGNLCMTELPSYTNEDGCWAAVKDCYSQNENCWKNAGLAAMHYCQFWEDNKCKPMEAECNGKNFNGPPNKGEDITPKPSTLPVDGAVGAPASQPTAAAGSNPAVTQPSSGSSSPASTGKSSEAATSGSDSSSSSDSKAAPASESQSDDNDDGDDDEDDVDVSGALDEDAATNDEPKGAAEDDTEEDAEAAQPKESKPARPSGTRPAGARITRFPGGHRRHRGHRHSRKPHRSRVN